MTKVEKLVERLKAILPQMIGTLPVCPFDRRSPDYWTTANDKPCHVCGGTEEVDKCRGADLRCMDDASDAMREAAALLQSLDRRVAELERFVRHVEDGLTWNSSESQCFDRISAVVRDFRRSALPDPPGPCEGRGREGVLKHQECGAGPSDLAASATPCQSEGGEA